MGSGSKQKLRFEIIESKDYLGHWHVEAIDNEGRVYVAIFSGSDAQKLAAEYADWKNGIRYPAAILQMVSR